MNAVRLGFDVHGAQDAPVLVLGPSLGTTRSVWDEALPMLSSALRVVRYDHRGHGGSDVPAGPYRLPALGADVLALLDALGVRRFHAGGLSLGGMVAMWLAANHPDRVDRLALCCTSAHMPPEQGWVERAARVRAEGTAAVADAVVARWLTPDFARERPEVLARLRDMLVATPAEGYAGCCEAIATMDLRPDLTRVQAPTLVIAGGEDLATPPEHAERIRAAVRGARLAVVEDAAHLAAVQRPDECARLMVEHLLGSAA